MVQKLQLDVVRVMFPHYLKELQDAHTREDKPNITELENAWVMRVSTEEEQKALQEKYIQDYLLAPIKALTADATIQVSWQHNPETMYHEAKIDNASADTLKTLEKLREELFKPKAIKDCIDVNQLLIAAYHAAHDNFNTFQNNAQRDAYAVLVIDLIQSLNPRLGKSVGSFGLGLYSRDVTLQAVALENYVKQKQQVVTNLCAECSSVAKRHQRNNPILEENDYMMTQRNNAQEEVETKTHSTNLKILMSLPTATYELPSSEQFNNLMEYKRAHRFKQQIMDPHIAAARIKLQEQGKLDNMRRDTYTIDAPERDRIYRDALNPCGGR